MLNLYREEILEHYREPLNFGKISIFDISSRQINPFCGDEIKMYVKFGNGKGEKQKVEDISFLGKGCAISIAATSMLTEYARKKTRKQLTNFGEKDMLEMLEIKVSETRKKCVLLGLMVIKDCLK